MILMQINVITYTKKKLSAEIKEKLNKLSIFNVNVIQNKIHVMLKLEIN